MNSNKYLTITTILFAVFCLILGSSNMRNNTRIKTNEALINHMAEEVDMNAARIHTFLDDADLAESWANSVYNMDNRAYVLEIAYMFQIPFEDVTQDMFNTRYLIKQIQQQE